MNVDETLAEAIREVKATRRTGEMTGIVGYLAGAAYALKLADGYFARRVAGKHGALYLDELATTLDALAANSTPPTTWLAGFHLNNALHRIAAAAERITRKRLRRFGRGFPDSKDWRKVWGPRDARKLRRVSDEANALKHRRMGRTTRGKMTRLHASEALLITARMTAQCWPARRKKRAA